MTSGDGLERPSSDKEWRLIEKVVTSSLKEQRRSRRWGIFFKILTFGYLFLLLYLFMGNMKGEVRIKGAHTALVEVKGVIASEEDASADRVITALRAAFEAKQSEAVILRINSPGGSPVQANYIYEEIERLRAIYVDKPLYAVIVDIGASGGYYIAAAADEIVADPSSLVGSIGVTSAGFGFVEAIDKLGIERRNYTSGEHKTFLDPFSPQKPEEVDFWQSVLNTTHQQFISKVEQGRGDKLNTDAPLLYSGVVWSGEQALEMGLIDRLGNSSMVARELVGAEEIVDYTLRRNPFEEVLGELGTHIGKGLGQSILGSRFDLR